MTGVFGLWMQKKWASLSSSVCDVGDLFPVWCAFIPGKTNTKKKVPLHMKSVESKHSGVILCWNLLLFRCVCFFIFFTKAEKKREAFISGFFLNKVYEWNHVFLQSVCWEDGTDGFYHTTVCAKCYFVATGGAPSVFPNKQKKAALPAPEKYIFTATVGPLRSAVRS